MSESKRAYVEFQTECWWFQHEDEIYWCVGGRENLERYRQERLIDKIPYDSSQRWVYDNVFNEDGFGNAHKEYSLCPTDLVAFCLNDGSVYIFSMKFQLPEISQV